MGPTSMTSWHTSMSPVTHPSLSETSLYFSNLPGLYLPLSLCSPYSLCSPPAFFSPHGSHLNVTSSEKPTCLPKFKVATYFPCLFISHILFLGEKKRLRSTYRWLNLCFHFTLLIYLFILCLFCCRESRDFVLCKFHYPQSLRTPLIYSRNLMTISGINE